MKLTSVLSNSDVETAIWKKDYTIIVCDNNTHISKNAQLTVQGLNLLNQIKIF